MALSDQLLFHFQPFTSQGGRSCHDFHSPTTWNGQSHSLSEAQGVTSSEHGFVIILYIYNQHFKFFDYSENGMTPQKEYADVSNSEKEAHGKIGIDFAESL